MDFSPPKPLPEPDQPKLTLKKAPMPSTKSKTLAAVASIIYGIIQGCLLLIVVNTIAPEPLGYQENLLSLVVISNYLGAFGILLSLNAISSKSGTKKTRIGLVLGLLGFTICFFSLCIGMAWILG